jgi:hypothetical protein
MKRGGGEPGATSIHPAVLKLNLDTVECKQRVVVVGIRIVGHKPHIHE